MDMLGAVREGELVVASGASGRLVRGAGYFTVHRPGRRCWWGTPVSASASRNLIGCAGAASFATTGSTASEADGQWQPQTTSAVLNNTTGAGGPTVATSTVQSRWRPVGFWAVKTGSDITNIRFAVGFHNHGAGTPSAVETNPTLHTAYFRYSTSAGDAGWVVHTSDGATARVSAVVFPVAADTPYYMAIDCRDPAAIQFWIGTDPERMILVHTAKQNLPGTSTGMYATLPDLTTLSANARAFKWGSIFFSSN